MVDDREQSRIATTRLERAARFARAGIRVGGNYLRHHVKRAITGEASREELHTANANDIYASLSELKGGALKVLQMLSLDDNLLPTSYREKFALARHSVPPLSLPLVVATFKRQLGKSPFELFDYFSRQAVAAASIGQVHRATRGTTSYAVKVQYPGIAESLVADLRLLKPFASILFQISERDVDYFFEEVQARLLEETSYTLELARASRIAAACAHLPDLVFPSYDAERSSERILTMQWLDGDHIDAFLNTNPPQDIRNRVGEALWRFYDFQIHQLHEVHADPHPGNFLIRADGTVGVLDFGCVKEIPHDFYRSYFRLLSRTLTHQREKFAEVLADLQFLHASDSGEDREILIDVFAQSIELLSKPFKTEAFDFSDREYFMAIHQFGESLSQMEVFRRSQGGRGPRDALYISRCYFGLYNILHSLKASIRTASLCPFLAVEV